MDDKEQDIFISAQHIVGAESYANNPQGVKRFVKDKLARALTEKIADERIKILEEEHSVSFRLELVVCTVDQFFAEVKKHARAYGHYTAESMLSSHKDEQS